MMIDTYTKTKYIATISYFISCFAFFIFAGPFWVATVLTSNYILGTLFSPEDSLFIKLWNDK